MQITKRHIIFFGIGTVVFFLVSLAAFFILIPTSSVFAVETPKSKSNDYVIALSPKNQLLKVPNMAPGDKASAPLTVMNKGEKDFTVDISSEMESGDTLYNKLDLKITDQKDNQPLYSGKLKDLKDLNLGILGHSKNKTFNISVGLPLDAGNEYQGIYTSVKFILTPIPQSPPENVKQRRDSKPDHPSSFAHLVKIPGEWLPGDKVRGTWDIQNTGAASKITEISLVTDKSYLTDVNGKPISSGSPTFLDFEKHIKISLYCPTNSLTPVYTGSLDQLLKDPQLFATVVCLSKGASQTVAYEASMDTGAGNDLRGVKGVLAFQLGTVPVKNNAFDPPFSTPGYSMKLGSTTPVKFEYYDSEDKLIEAEQDVRLVVTGGNLGQGITYTLGNGSLSFHGGHYQANILVASNRFKVGQIYTATVYIGSTRYCQKSFSVVASSHT